MRRLVRRRLVARRALTVGVGLLLFLGGAVLARAFAFSEAAPVVSTGAADCPSVAYVYDPATEEHVGDGVRLGTFNGTGIYGGVMKGSDGAFHNAVFFVDCATRTVTSVMYLE